jgi:hypothetical protein
LPPYAVELNGVLDQCLIDGIRPKDSNLRTSGMSLLQLRITTGAAVDLLTGTPAGTMTAFSLNITTIETIELPDAKGVVTSPLYLQKRSYQDIAIPSTNANLQIALPIGNALRGVTLLATINGEPSNAVINNIQLASGVDVRVNMPGSQLQRMGTLDNVNQGILTNTTLWSSSTSGPHRPLFGRPDAKRSARCVGNECLGLVPRVRSQDHPRCDRRRRLPSHRRHH